MQRSTFLLWLAGGLAASAGLAAADATPVHGRPLESPIRPDFDGAEAAPHHPGERDGVRTEYAQYYRRRYRRYYRRRYRRYYRRYYRRPYRRYRRRYRRVYRRYWRRRRYYYY